MDHRKLGLRVYATATGYPAAFDLAGRLVDRVSAIVAVQDCRVYPYRKFENCFGLWLELSSSDQDAAFDSLWRTVAPGWVEQGGPGERSAIWDRETHGGVSVLPEAIWMHLNLCSAPEGD